MGFALKPPPGNAGKAWPAIVVLFGCDTGTIGGILALPYWLKTISTGAMDGDGKPSITTDQSSEIVSILSAGTFFGALTAAPVGDIMGRRFGLMFSAGIVFNLGIDKAWKAPGFTPTVSFQEVQEVQVDVDARKALLVDMETAAMRKKSIGSAHEVPGTEKV